ncbi:MAG: hypothetical protein ACRC50_12975, partial [Gaiella sp.]
MGIADGIDRLLRTLRPPAAAPSPPGSDATARFPAVTSGNGRDPLTVEHEPAAQDPERRSTEPPPEEPSTDSAGTLTGALAARVEEVYLSHREATVAEEPAEAAVL